MAAELRTNECCLFHGLDEAIAGAEQFAVEQPEPGDYYVIEVLERRQGASDAGTFRRTCRHEDPCAR